MGIEAASSTSSVSSTSQASQVSSASNSDNAKKASTDSSFKDEMNKVSSKDSKQEDKEVKSADSEQETLAVDDKSQEKTDTLKDLSEDNQFSDTLTGSVDYSKFAAMSLNDANMRLSNDIMQMMNTNTIQALQAPETVKNGSIFSFDNAFQSNVSLTESDAQFFINLTKTNDVSVQNTVAQAQTLISQGAEAPVVIQNAKISQTLLNALSQARETNQPLRIDFDQNVSVILRIGKDGALAAHFIPGDKAVEQYLRNNMETLKATFRDNDLPYSDLSYSNSSKQQNERRRNKQQQGE